MQISHIRSYNISKKQNLKKNNVAFQQAPIDKTLKTVMNNPNSKKVFIKLAEVLGLSAIIAWVTHLSKNNNEEVSKVLSELEMASDNKCNEFLLNTDTMDKYLDINATSDEIESVLTTLGKGKTGSKLDVSTNDLQDESLTLFLDSDTRDVYLENRKECAIKNLVKQTDAVLKASEEKRETFVKALDTKISNLSKQMQELSVSESTSAILNKIKNIAKMQSIIMLMQDVSSSEELKSAELHIEEENENFTESKEPKLVEIEESENSVNEDIQDNVSTGVKIVGQIDPALLESMRGGRKTYEKHSKNELPYESQEVIITPRNKKLVDAFNYAYKNKNGTFPIEAYGNKLEFIKEIYDGYGRKDKVKDVLLNILVKENMNQVLDKYKSLLRSDKNNLDFINFVKLEKLKATEGGTLSKEEFDKISDCKDVVIKYLYALPEDGRLTLSFKENISVAERLEHIVDFHKMIFNVNDQKSVEDFSEPIGMDDVKIELIKRLVEDPNDYPNIMEYLGVDVSEIIIQLNANNEDEAESIAEETLMQPEIEDNIRRLVTLLNNEKFTDFFASTHSRMRFIERYVMNNFDTINYDNIGNSKEKEKAIRKLDKDLNKSILSSIATLKKEIQRIEEIDIFNYKMGNVNYKNRYSSFPRIKVYDNVIGLNEKGQIHTIFINENFS